MRVFEGRKEVIRGSAQCRIIAGARRPFVHPPTVVAAFHDRRIDLLVRVLADVRHPLLMGGAIETETPRIAPADGEDLVPPPRPVVGGVARRRVGRAADRVGTIDIDAQNLPEQQIDVLGVVRRSFLPLSPTAMRGTLVVERNHAVVVAL
jgi:hypothetical protein